VKFLSLLKKIGLPLFALTVLGTSLDQLITVKMETMLMNPDGASNWVWVLGGLSLLLNLLYPLLALLLVLSQMRSIEPGDQQVENGFQFLQKNLKPNLIEEMRAWGNAMLWSFLFLIPGLIRFLRYLLLPFVVSFDPQYKSGHRDALRRARELSRGHLLQLFVLFCFFALIVPIGMSALDEWKLVWNTPLPALGICLIEMLINICFILCLWKVYQRSLSHEPSLSMERNSVP
jgi:hypothetical protein